MQLHLYPVQLLNDIEIVSFICAACEDVAKTEEESDKNDSDDESAWMDVDATTERRDTQDSAVPSGVEVRLDKNTMSVCKQKKSQSAEEVFKRALSRAARELQAYKHRVHLLCLLGNLVHRSRLADDPLVQGLCLSNVLTEWTQAKTPRSWRVADLACMLAWFRRTYTLCRCDRPGHCSSVTELVECAERAEVWCADDLVLLFVSTVRALGGSARLVASFQPLSWKPQKCTSKSGVASKRKIVDMTSKDKKKTGRLCGGQGDYQVKTEPALVGEGDLGCWAEVLLSKEGNRWITVDCLCSRGSSGAVDDVGAVLARCRRPLVSVMSVESGGLIAEVTARYDPLWGTTTRHIRDSSWWLDTLNGDWVRRRSAADAVVRAEAEDFHTRQRAVPLPSNPEQLRGHPLYAMQRHLHKYEVIYPTDASPVAHLRGEPVYARESVHVCHTRETWLRAARTIIPGSVPAKSVKAMMTPKRKLLAKDGEEQRVDVFGHWQTEEYEPPSLSEDGKVPRNEFGNVDLYKPSMLPHGCTHIKLSGYWQPLL